MPRLETPTNQLTPPPKKIFHTLDFKLRIVNMADNGTPLKEIARQYKSVKPYQIREWRKKKAALEEVSVQQRKHSKTLHLGKRPPYAELESMVADWIVGNQRVISLYVKGKHTHLTLQRSALLEFQSTIDSLC